MAMYTIDKKYVKAFRSYVRDNNNKAIKQQGEVKKIDISDVPDAHNKAAKTLVTLGQGGAILRGVFIDLGIMHEHAGIDVTATPEHMHFTLVQNTDKDEANENYGDIWLYTANGYFINKDGEIVKGAVSTESDKFIYVGVKDVNGIFTNKMAQKIIEILLIDLLNMNIDKEIEKFLK